jgi:2-polyprenyl-6-methoxyphenol hydroxylase-like FAD-dependent oxidoreductase
MDSHVLIVGAGPAGAALAQLLATRGVEVLLIERQRDFAREFRGEVLMPSGVDAIEQMGLARALAGIPRSLPISLELFANGRSFLRVDAGPELLGGQPPLAMSQPALLGLPFVATLAPRIAPRLASRFLFGAAEVKLRV